MTGLRRFRFISGGLLLFAGIVLCFQYLRPAGDVNGVGKAMICLIAGICLLSPGRRMLRNLVGGGLLVMFMVSVPTAIAPEPGMGNFGPVLMAMCLLILSAIMFSGTLSQLAARPLTSIIDGIYFGNNSREAPPITLRLARAYRRDLRFEEATEECERQLEYHPRSADLWFEMIHIARESGDEKAVQEQLRKARRRLSPEECRQLDFEFQRDLPVGAETSVAEIPRLAAEEAAAETAGRTTEESAAETGWVSSSRQHLRLGKDARRNGW